MIKKISPDFLLPSSAFTINRGKIKFYKEDDKKPEVGDLVLAEVIQIGQHQSIENKSGRIHTIHHGTKLICVFGNRYAPDYYEGVVPSQIKEKEIDLLARSGVVGVMRTKSAKVSDPTKVKIIGYICDSNGNIINTKDYSLIKNKIVTKKKKRSKMILVCGTSMNSGKSTAAVAICRALKIAGHSVRSAKITGTASLKDILGMNDAGAKFYVDFSYLGFPSTYLLPEKDLLHIFNSVDLKYANNPKNYWIVEFADGINQKETKKLLESKEVQERIHKFIFCAGDAFGAIGGLKILKENFNIVPDAISGICSGSPLHIEEIKGFTDLPVFDSFKPNIEELIKLITSSNILLK